MKKFLIILITLIAIVSCKAQLRSNYVINFNQHPSAAKYLVFLEERQTPIGFALQDSVDYLQPSLLDYKIAETTSATPVIVNLKNDGKYIRAGLVVEDSAGYYSVMGVSAVIQKGTIPSKPTLITIIKQ